MMREGEIHSGYCYFTPLNWKLRVDSLSRLSGKVEYEVVSGPMRGHGGTTNLKDFAARVVRMAIAPATYEEVHQ